MKIVIFKRDDYFVADALLPGSPPIGRGKTKQEAIGRLILYLQDLDGITDWSKIDSTVPRIYDKSDDAEANRICRADCIDL